MKTLDDWFKAGKDAATALEVRRRVRGNVRNAQYPVARLPAALNRPTNIPGGGGGGRGGGSPLPTGVPPMILVPYKYFGGVGEKWRPPIVTREELRRQKLGLPSLTPWPKSTPWVRDAEPTTRLVPIRPRQTPTVKPTWLVAARAANVTSFAGSTGGVSFFPAGSVMAWM